MTWKKKKNFIEILLTLTSIFLALPSLNDYILFCYSWIAFVILSPWPSSVGGTFIQSLKAARVSMNFNWIKKASSIATVFTHRFQVQILNWAKRKTNGRRYNRHFSIDWLLNINYSKQEIVQKIGWWKYEKNCLKDNFQCSKWKIHEEKSKFKFNCLFTTEKFKSHTKELQKKKQNFSIKSIESINILNAFIFIKEISKIKSKHHHFILKIIDFKCNVAHSIE